MVMSHRERFLTAVDLKQPDVVPITDLGLDSPIIEAITGESLGAFSLVGGSGDNPWAAAVESRITLGKACLKLGFDGVPIISDYALCSKGYKPKVLSGTRFIDEWGRVLDARKDTKTTWWVNGTVETEEDMENYVPPDPEAEGMYEMAEKAVNSLKGKDAAVVCQGHAGWHMAFQVRGGIDKLVIDMYRRPEAAKKFMNKIAETCRGMVKLMLEAGAEVAFITDDYADCRSPLMSLKQFREFELPNIRRMVALAKKKGVPVLKHSDGNVYPILDDMVEAGIRGIHPVEPGAMDLGDVKERYGSRVCVLGNVDCRFVLPFGTEEEVRRDVRRCIDAASKNGGYVLTSSNSLHANCKVENIRVMVDEARKYGKYL
ncbi:MAG: uroporphyrinogen decarboxylase family protein [Candidatus Bathyarchaeia archaeon]